MMENGNAADERLINKRKTRPGWQGGLNNLAESWGFEPQIPLGGILA